MNVVLGADTSGFTSAMQEVGRTMKQTGDSVQSAMNGAEGSTSKGTGKMKSALVGLV